MYIFSSSPRNQLPNHGLRITGKKSPLLQAAARRLSFSPKDQLPNHGLRAGDKYYWEMVPATSSTSLAPQLFAVEPAAWPGSGGRRLALLEDDNHYFKQQPDALVLPRGNQLFWPWR